VLEVNLKTPFVLTQVLLPFLRAAASDENPARVINISSISAIKPWAQDGFSYCASKAGLIRVSENLARELAGERITVNSILPGSVLTENLKEHVDIEEVTKRVALGRLGGAADMAGAVMFLCSAAGAWVTGTTLTIDGGQLLLSNC
jgi:NAD(P)-dependent dehydrogenase (short-subunit alcohol dehydrogenase family)